MFESKFLGLVITGFFETIYMTLAASLLAYVIGLPLGVFLSVSRPEGISPRPLLNKICGAVVNLLRSVPFVILLVAAIPLTRLITGTSVGSSATIVPLVIASFPIVARSVEASASSVRHGVIEAAQSMGATNMQIITKVILPEAVPSLITGAASSLITVLGFSAMAGVCGGGGLGSIVINYGYYRGETGIMYVLIVVLVLLVQIIQEAGARLSVRSDRNSKSSN
ncbi:MAG: ABC transporter permease [Oscillospiraceae bacterium]|nr:ABC transporter permease [Oscillospiraceae bacterium]MBR4928368.1 ABC transporter permease [Oscillospiraceae bacterium]